MIRGDEIQNYYMNVTDKIDYEWAIDNKSVYAGFPDCKKIIRTDESG